MRLYSHFSVNTLSNTYLIGLPSGRAILIDPGVFGGDLLELIEHRSYSLDCILLTHTDAKHLGGLHTIMRVYSGVQVYAATSNIGGIEAIITRPQESMEVCGTLVEVAGFPGYGRDCLGYRIGDFLFCGPAFSAGELGAVSNAYAKAILAANIADFVFTLPDETIILPFYGPPTTVSVERRTMPAEDPPEL